MHFILPTLLAFLFPMQVASYVNSYNSFPPAPIYHQSRNSVVMTKPINIYLIYYGKFKPEEKSVIEDFVRTLNQSAHWDVVKRYYQYDAQGRKQYVSSNITLAKTTEILDYSFLDRMNITKLNLAKRLGDDVRDIVLDRTGKGELPLDENGIYLVLGDSTVSEKEMGFGWHYYFTIYRNYKDQNSNDAFYKYAWISNPKNAFNGRLGPNWFPYSSRSWSLADIYEMVSTIYHEIAEAATDPYPDSYKFSWVNQFKEENADLCSFNYGHARKIKSGPYGNLRYNFGNGSVPYYIQSNFDLQTQRCATLFPYTAVNDCQILQNAFPTLPFGDDCCVTPFATCVDGKVVDITIKDINLNSLTDISNALDGIKTLTNLEILVLNKVSSLVGNLNFTKLCQFPKLMTLSLSLLYITPTQIDPCIGTVLTNLVDLNMTRSKLIGPIPSTLSLLSKLQTLDLSGNNLTGSIPEMSKLPDLFLLNVKDNPLLTGKIQPGSLSKSDPTNTLLSPPYNFCNLNNTKICLDVNYTGPDCLLAANRCQVNSSQIVEKSSISTNFLAQTKSITIVLPITITTSTLLATSSSIVSLKSTSTSSSIVSLKSTSTSSSIAPKSGITK